MFDWFKRNTDPADHAVDLTAAVERIQPVQGGPVDEAPRWAQKLIRFLVAKWPTLLNLLLLILEQATEKLSTADRADATIALNRYRNYTAGQFHRQAKALEAQ